MPTRNAKTLTRPVILLMSILIASFAAAESSVPAKGDMAGSVNVGIARTFDNDFDDRSPRSLGRNVGRGEYRDLDYDRSDRDFFDRASDEVRSWFGDDRAERRRELDERMGAGRGYVGQRYNFEAAD